MSAPVSNQRSHGLGWGPGNFPLLINGLDRGIVVLGGGDGDVNELGYSIGVI